MPNKTEGIQDDKFGQLMKNNTVHLLALFLMVYVGIEVTIGGIICLFIWCSTKKIGSLYIKGGL